jgi:Flp pilus assembly pilin Flp
MDDEKHDSEKGQALIEFVVLVPILTLVILGTGSLFRITFKRTECARLVFEGVRNRLEGGSALSLRRAGGEVRTLENGVEGRLKCGAHTETLFLPKIDERNAGVLPSRFSF